MWRLIRSFFKLLKKDSATALSQQFPLRLMLGTSWLSLHQRLNPPTKESLELATLEWVSWFNHHRLLEPIGYIPPTEAEDNYYRQLASQAVTSF